MDRLNRRNVLLGGAAMTALAACGEATVGADVPLPRTDMPPQPDGSYTPASKVNTGVRDGLAIAAEIKAGTTTAAAETAAAIARAKSVNGKLNAIATDMYDMATVRADTDLSGPYAGVPTFIKDLMNWKGAQSMLGSRAFKGYVPDADAPLAASWRKAGVVPIGKSTTPEMGLISSTEPLVTGPTRNPWNPDRIPGGSSGGAAALVAARVTPFAHASDGGGSIRIPAACCGVFGLKPSASRLGARGGAKPPVDISVSHAVTLTVRDSIALFKAAETNNGSYKPLGPVYPQDTPLRIAYAPDPATNTAVDAATRKGLDETAELCRTLGHEVVNFKLPFDGAKFSDAFLMYWAAGAAAFAQDASRFSGKPIGPDILEPWTLGLAKMAGERQSDLPGLVGYLISFQDAYHAVFKDFDILLSPVTGSVPVPIGEQAPDGDFDQVMESVLRFAAFTSPMNVAGAASMSVPLAWSDDGLPIGAMFSGKKGDDGLLFSLALQLEAAKPWIGMIPPISAE